MTDLKRFAGQGVLVTGAARGIAAAITFLASADAAWITGTTLVVDGGLTAVHTAFRTALQHP